MQCCRAKLEGAGHFVHHTHFAGSQSRRMGRHRNTGGTSFTFAAEGGLRGIQRPSVPLLAPEQLQIFAENDAELLFVRIREPEEIERFFVGQQACRLPDHSSCVDRHFSRHADGWATAQTDGVAAYAYDAESLNDGSLEELPAKVHDFLQALIKR